MPFKECYYDWELSGTIRWTLATTLGLVLSSMVRPYIAFHTSLIASGAFGGLIIGGIQGLVFYTQIPGMAWWVFIKVISGAVSWGLGWSILGYVTHCYWAYDHRIGVE